MEKKISQEEFNEEILEIVRDISNYLKNTESPSDACKDFIFELVTELGESHFTTVGILTEALFEWRNISDKVLSEEKE